jgi:Tfp pilus assembly protein PilV
VKRVGLAAAAAFVSVNIWTGAPLLALWVGSRAVPDSGLSMGAVFLVVLVLLVSVLALAWLLNRINERYDRLTGREAQRRVSPWLRSMRSEREELVKQRHGVSAIERVVVISVMAAAAVFNFWFFFLAGSPI